MSHKKGENENKKNKKLLDMENIVANRFSLDYETTIIIIIIIIAVNHHLNSKCFFLSTMKKPALKFIINNISLF